jgi:hypothetical protein
MASRSSMVSPYFASPPSSRLSTSIIRKMPLSPPLRSWERNERYLLCASVAFFSSRVW